MSASAEADLSTEAMLLVAADEGIRPNFARWSAFAGLRPGEDWIELQALRARRRLPRDMREGSYVAHANSVDAAVKLLEDGEKAIEAIGWYVIANRVDPAVASRQTPGQWHQAVKGASTSDRDIAARMVLIVDVDATRAVGTSASDAELARTVPVAEAIHARFASLLSPDTLGYAHSGNGRGVYVALDALRDADAAPLIRGIVAALSSRYECAGVSIDTSVVDAKRLVPAHGTLKRKGASGIGTRPHRRTAFVCSDHVTRASLADLRRVLEALRTDLAPDQIAAVDRAMGIKAKSLAPRAADSPFARANAVPMSDVAAWVGLHDGDRPRCPGCGESDSGVAIVGNGLKCSHARCASKGVRDGFRTPVDVVAEVRGVEPRDAVALMADRFGFAGFAEPVPTLEPPRTFRSPAVRARALGRSRARVASGVPTLDAALRGGLQAGRVLVVGGAPGAGKTTWTTQLAYAMAKQGIPTAILAADEEADGLAVRIGQLEGFTRDDLESGAKSEALAAILEPLPLELIDADEEDATVEDAASKLATYGDATLRVLIVDSIQTVRAEGTDTADGPRARVDAVVRALKRAAKQHSFIVIATCELARGAYRSKDRAEQIDDLAAFKESGGIEYGASVALVLRSIEGRHGDVDVTMPKNRLGQKVPFRLGFDRDRARYEEIPIVDDAPRGASGLSEAMASVMRLLGSARDLTSKNQICRRINMAKRSVLAAVDELIERGDVVFHDKAYRLASEVQLPGSKPVPVPIPKYGEPGNRF